MSKILLNAGGTGGHFFPAIALYEHLKQHGHQVNIVTDQRCKKFITANIQPDCRIVDIRLKSNNFSGKLKLLIDLVGAVCQSLILLIKIRPAIVVSFGGYPTVPTIIAAIILRIPLALYEQNCIIGKTNKFFVKFAKLLALSYKETVGYKISPKKTIIVGNLLRANIRRLSVKYSFDNNIFRILVIGGSQGARIFSELIPQAIKALIAIDPNVKIEIVQQAAKSDQDSLSNIYSNLSIRYRLSEFFYDIDQHYDNCELIICRSGTSTIGEISKIGLPAIFIPYPYAADNHQLINAKAIEQRGGGWCFEEAKLTPEILAAKIYQLIINRSLLSTASDNLVKNNNDNIYLFADTIKKLIP